MAKFLTAPTIRTPPRKQALEVTPFGPASKADEVFASGLSEVFRELSNQLYPVIAEDRKRQAGQDAAADVEAGTFKVRPAAFTIRSQEYNRAGVTMTAGRLETAGISKILSLSHKYRNDPRGFMANLRAYAAGVRAELLPMNAEVAEMVHNRLIERGMPFVERAGNVASAEVRDRTEAAMIELDASTTALFDTHARDLFDRDAAVSGAAGAAIDKLVDEWMLQFNKVDANGKPVFSEAEKAKHLLSVRRRAVEIGVREYLRKSDDLPGDILKLTEGELKLTVGGVEVTPSQYLSPRQYDVVLTEAQQLLRARNKAVTSAESAADKEMKDRSKKLRLDYVDTILQKGARREYYDQIFADMEDGKLTPEDAEFLTKFVDKHLDEQGETESDRLVFNEALRLMYAEGEDPTEYILENKDRLSKADMSSLLSKAKTIFGGSEAEGALTPEQKTYFGLLKERLKPEGPAAALLDPAALRRRIDAQQEYYERVRAGEEPKAVYDDILRRTAKVEETLLGNDDPPLPPRSAVFVKDKDGNDTRRLDLSATVARLESMAKSGQISGEPLDVEFEILRRALLKAGETPAMVDQVFQEIRLMVPNG
jgi:hypothetical protein